MRKFGTFFYFSHLNFKKIFKLNTPRSSLKMIPPPPKKKKRYINKQDKIERTSLAIKIFSLEVVFNSYPLYNSNFWLCHSIRKIPSSVVQEETMYSGRWVWSVLPGNIGLEVPHLIVHFRNWWFKFVKAFLSVKINSYESGRAIGCRTTGSALQDPRVGIADMVGDVGLNHDTLCLVVQ